MLGIRGGRQVLAGGIRPAARFTDETLLMRRIRRNFTRSIAESLEARRLMIAAPWGAAPALMRLDDLANDLPSIDGSGQTIAVIDTGVDYTQPGLGGAFGPGHKVIGGYDFVDNDADPLDTNGHGTGVAGIIAADSFESGGYTYRGVAPAAKIVAIRIAADTSAVPLSVIEQGLQWVIDNQSTYHVSVVNLSFGFGMYTEDHVHPQLSDELQTLADMGIAFVASAGNGGLDDGQGISYPAADANAFSVGSVNTADVISEFSQRSSNLDLLAVGEGVVTVARGGGYVGVAGTSFSAPSLTGTLALMREVDSNFTIADLHSMIRASSPTNVDGDNETGVTTGLTFQRLDIFSSVKLALQRKGEPAQAALIGADGNESDIAIDDQGVTHFVWYDNDAATMKYATKNAYGTFSAVSTIDTGGPSRGTELSLKLDSYGRPTIAYLDGPSGDLKLAQYLNGEGWTTRVADSNGVTGLYPSLAIGADNTIYISYFRKTNRDLKMATYKDGVWERETVDGDGDVGWSSTITLDENGKLAIAYGDAGRNRLKLARKLTTAFTTEVVDGNTIGAAYISLAFNPAGYPVMSYYELGPSDLKLATKGPGGWTNTRVASKGATGLYTNLRLDDNGVPSILYWDKGANQLNRATQTGSTTFKITKIRSKAGKYTVAVRSDFDDKWTYSTNTGTALLLGSL
jgi:hypothetical protein